MENNNNNGRGIFYGVIGVATLVVAIIGATFAYFSATVGANNAIEVGSTKVELHMIEMDSNFKTDMVPVDTYFDGKDVNGNGVYTDDGDEAPGPVDEFKTFPGMTKTGQGAGTCVDLVGNSICGVYTFTVSNPSTTTAQTVMGSLTTTANTGFVNLKYAVFKGKPTGENAITSYDVNASAASTKNAAVGTLVHKGDIPAMTQTDQLTQTWTLTEELLAAQGKTSYTVVVWLEETGGNQNAEMQQTFAASITFSSPEGGGVTGVLTANS